MSKVEEPEYFVIGITEGKVVVSNKNGEYLVMSKEDALYMASQKALIGVINNQIGRCVKHGNKYISDLFFQDKYIYRYYNGKYIDITPMATSFNCRAFVCRDLVIITRNGKYDTYKPELFSYTNAISDLRIFHIDDDRDFIAIQGAMILGEYCRPAFINEILVMEDKLSVVYKSNIKRFKEIVKHYKEVSQNSTDIEDIKQRAINGFISRELDCMEVSILNNHMIIGNVSFSLGGAVE